MDRVTHYECAGWGFESLYPHHRHIRQLTNLSFAVFFLCPEISPLHPHRFAPSKQFHTSQQHINQVAVENAVIVIKIVRHIHTDDNFLEKIFGKHQ